MSTEIDYNEVSFVISSDYREEVMKALLSGPKTPSEIEDATGVDIAHVSRALSRLDDRGMVELLVSEDTKKGRIYGLTDQGEPTAKAVADRE